MRDTSPEMQKKQYEIFFRLPLNERIKQAVDMVNFGLMIVEKSIKSKNQNISDKELKIEKIKRLYKNDFSEVELERIIAHFESL